MAGNIFADTTVGFKWQSFGRYQFGKGFVAFEAKPEVDTDPSVMFVHVNAEALDGPENMEVENDCRELVRLLAKFRIAREMLSERAQHEGRPIETFG